jgi:glycerate dehydrogenase
MKVKEFNSRRKRMKIVILDGYTLNPGDLSWEGFEKLGEVTKYDRIPIEDTVRKIGDAPIVLTNKVPITKEVLEQCPQIKYIGALATGYNTIDVQEATKRGIVVSNIPAYGTAAVAQMTLALLLEICNRVGHHSDAVFQGRWESNLDFCFWDYPLIELAGKTIGIIGFGRIGQKTATLMEALDINVLAYNGYKDKSLESKNCRYTDLKTLYKESDIISLHCPLTKDTEGIINKETIAKMKDGVIILNTSRGPLIVEEDLVVALNNGKVAAAGLDVVSVEPIVGDNPLLKAKNCYITPHIAWASKESRQRLMDIAVSNLEAFIKGEPINTVN